MNDTLEQIKIEIISDNDKAVTNIKKIASSFRSFKKATEDLSSLKSTYNILKKIDSLSFKNPIKGLNSIVTAFKALKSNSFTKNIVGNKNINLQTQKGKISSHAKETPKEEIVASAIDSKQFENLGKAFDFDSTFIQKLSAGKMVNDELLDSFHATTEQLKLEQNQIEVLTEKINSIPKQKNIFGEEALTSETKKLSELRNQMIKILSQKNELSLTTSSALNGLNSAILSNDATKITEEIKVLQQELIKLKKLSSAFDSVSASANAMIQNMDKGTSKIKKFIKSFGRVALYRAIREVLKSFSEGLQSVAMVDDKFNSSMSEITSSIKYLRNSLITLAVPIIEVFTPIISALSNLLTGIINQFTIMFNMLAGETSYTVATKSVEDYTKALKEAQKQTTGFDEINKIGDNSQPNYDSMFTEKEMTGWDIAGSTASITALIAGATTLIALIKGAKIKETFLAMGDGLKKGYSFLSNMKTWQKGITAVAMLATQAVIAEEAFYGMFTGSKSVGEGLLELIPICVLVGIAMTAMFGPVGIAIMAVVVALSALVAGFRAVSKSAKDNAMEKFWNTQGTSIQEVQSLLNDYMDSININKLTEWNESIETSTSNFNDLSKNYKYAMTVLSKKIELGKVDSSDIENLSNSFDELAESAKRVNEAQINSLMASINTAIELNINDELLNRLTDLSVRLGTAMDLLNSTIDSINGEYKALLHEVAETIKNGGTISSEQWAQLQSMKEELDKFTLTDTTASVDWNLSLQDALSKGVSLDFDNVDELKELLEGLNSDRQSYLDVLHTNYVSGLSTLQQLVDLGLTDENGNPLFTQDDIDAYTASYEAMVAEVNAQFDAVIQAIYDSLSANAMDNPQNGWKDAFAWAFDWDYYGEKDAYKEQQAILALILSFLSGNGYASGGFPNSGEVFMARENGIPEMVGKFGNRTAVANNDQIIEGIKQGVYEAMLESQKNTDDSGNIIIQFVDRNGRIQSEQIISSAERRNRRDGKRVIAVNI